jgi:CHAT domain-containing protein/Tfp pilus assembly protein PilF
MIISLKNISIIFLCLTSLVHPGININALCLNNPDTIVLTNPIDTLDSLMRYYNLSGLKYLSDGDYELAEKYLNNSLEIKQKILSENDRRIGNEHVNLGVLYEKIWKYELAIMHYNKAEQIFKSIDSNYIHIGSIYVNKAIIYRKLLDYQKAIDYNNYAIRIFNKQDPIDYDKLSIVLSNLGLIYELLGDNNKAIGYLEKSLLFEHNKIIERQIGIYDGLAINFGKLNKNSVALKYYEQIILIGENEFGKDDYRLVGYYMNYGLFLIENLKKYDEGFSYYEKALRIYLSKFGENDYNTILCLNNIGEYYLLKAQIDSALFYFQRAIKAAYPNSVTSSIYSNPNIQELSLNPNAFSSFKLKAKSLDLLFEKNKDLESLESSLETYLLVYELINRIRLKYENESSNFIISEKEDMTFIEGLTVSEKLFKLTKDPKYIKIAFEINEKRQAFSLLTSIRKVEAKEFGGIPLYLLKQENDIYRQIAAYEELLFEEQRFAQPDKNRINLWEDKLFKLNQEYEKIINRFELEYPKYYQLKYDVSVKSIEEIQKKINENENLISYCLSDSAIHYFVINSDRFNMFTIEIDTTFNKYLRTLTLDLSRTNFSLGVHASYSNYKKAAYELYKILIQPCQEMIKGKSLIIIPDGALSYLPFEALLTSPVMNEEPDYRNLPYLIREYDVGYSYSSTLHFQDQRKTTKPTGNLLAFAPDYSNLITQNIIDLSFLDAYRDQLVPIPGVKDEVKMISRMIKSDIYIDESATENNFKKLAGNYDILHLAMHTIVDNENPMYSKLAFTQNVDSFEDGFLNTYEIYNMKYNARLAVLSSCQTGYGKLQKGEGVMSLARGFMYAGCPSIIMTLWQVSDRSGARLMKDFYRSLKNGKNKTSSLRDAKLDFLRKADQLKAHPYFWSTYVVIGDSSPLYPSRTRFLWIIITLFLIASAGAGAYWYFIIRPKKNKNTGKLRQDSIYS